MLSYEDAGRWSDSDGRVTHVNMQFDSQPADARLAGADYQSPRHHAEDCEQARKWSSVPYVVDGVLVQVDDIDAHYARSVDAGAKILSELEDNPGIGQRQYRAEDLEGHRWMFTASLRA
jgi:uncharacterized glyoxalase superfamily protein PhnB